LRAERGVVKGWSKGGQRVVKETHRVGPEAAAACHGAPRVRRKRLPGRRARQAPPAAGGDGAALRGEEERGRDVSS
jgi:hypothetical protein